jgi:hypothetical protein
VVRIALFITNVFLALTAEIVDVPIRFRELQDCTIAAKWAAPQVLCPPSIRVESFGLSD